MTVQFAVLQLLINEIQALTNFDFLKLAKYLRCMLQVILPLDDDLAVQVLNQALQIVSEGSHVSLLRRDKV